MRLLNFTAKNVHEYLNFDVTFRDDVNFFSGLNGCGKTTALKLIVALIDPDLRQLKTIKFDYCDLRLSHEGKEYVIVVDKKKEKFSLTVKVDGQSKTHTSLDPDDLDSPNWELVKRKMLMEEAEIDAALLEIHKLPDPMFLSLERTNIKSESRERDYSISYEDSDRFRRKSRLKSYNNLNHAIEIISRACSRTRHHQAKIDKDLRDKIIKNSLSFDTPIESMAFPDSRSIRELNRKQGEIERTLDSLDISSDEFSGHYKAFFEKISLLAEELENKGGDTFSDSDNMDPKIREAMYEWFVNQGQLKRIDSIFDLVQSYQQRKKKIYRSLDKFETLVNNFLRETNKELFLNREDGPRIRVGKKDRSLSVLSSGESQILCMLAHLVLNTGLQKDGIFIVDEPELSLHISWQDMFVEAVQAANPDLQVILATHSPAIIGGRNEMFVPLHS
ncbi:AAA family ATPase [Idiomarina sp. HB]|uniref:AAA family ATPase n=1 Tax=Idiomarina sp. HB TaxID=3110479 RepID=UPI003A809D15